MTNFPKATVEATNTKTGTRAFAVCAYDRRCDGKGMVEVLTFSGRRAFWEAAHVELGAA